MTLAHLPTSPHNPISQPDEPHLLNHTSRSLSLRGNATQDTILFELNRLKRYIEQSLQVSLRHSDGFSHTLGDPSDARVAQNLRNLARAAQNFHSSASSTASSIHDAAGRTAGEWNGELLEDGAGSVGGGELTVGKRERIREYLDQTREETAGRMVGLGESSIADPVASLSKDEAGDDDDEAEFESLFLGGLEEASKQSMLKQDYAKAETFLEKAIEIQSGLSPLGDADTKHLQILLIICYFFQHKWQLAEPLIARVAKSKANLDSVVCNLLHALALAHLSAYHFDEAIRVCRQALKGKKKLKETFGASHELDYNQTLGLLATIHDTKGDLLEPEVLRLTIPQWFTYSHPFDEVEFLSTHPAIFQNVLGENTPPDWGQEHASRRQPVMAELAGGHMVMSSAEEEEEMEGVSRAYDREPAKPRALQVQLDLHEKFEADTSKEVVFDIPSSASESDETGDVTFSPTTSSSSTISDTSSSRPPSSPRLALKRSFTRSFTRLLGTVRHRPSLSPDALTTPPQSPAPEYTPLPLPRRLSRRQKLRKTLSDSALFSFKKVGTRLQKRASARSAKKPSVSSEGGGDGRSFRVLGAKQINYQSNGGETREVVNQQPPEKGGGRRDVYSWFGLDIEDGCPGYSENGPSGDSSKHEDSFESYEDTRWETSSRILGTGPVTNHDGSHSDDSGTRWDTAPRILAGNPVNHAEPRYGDAHDNPWITHWDTALRILDGNEVCYVELPDNAVGGGSRTPLPKMILKNPAMGTGEDYRHTPETEFPSRPKRPSLSITIPDSSKNPGRMPPVVHYPRQRPPQFVIDPISKRVNNPQEPPSITTTPTDYYHRNTATSGSRELYTLEPALQSRRTERPRLSITIPNSSTSPERVPLVVQYPGQRPPQFVIDPVSKRVHNPKEPLGNSTTAVRNEYDRNTTALGSNSQYTPELTHDVRRRRPELSITIPNSSKHGGFVPLASHYPRGNPQQPLVNKVNDGINDPQGQVFVPRHYLPPSPPLSVKEGDLFEVSGEEVGCPLEGSNWNGTPSSEGCMQDQPAPPKGSPDNRMTSVKPNNGTEEQQPSIGLGLSMGSPLKNHIASVKPNIATEEVQGWYQRLPHSPPESVIGEEAIGYNPWEE
jgi:tetratricopeptide (TPR) repeat protein